MQLSQLLARNRLIGFSNSSDSKNKLQLLVFLAFSVMVIGAIHGGTHALLNKLDSLTAYDRYSTVLNLASEWISVGDLIKERLFSMVMLAIFFMLLFSNLISSLGHIFLSQDTELLLASPRPNFHIFRARFIESTLSSSWMSLFFFLPVIFAYTQNYQVQFYRFLPFFLALIPFLIIPSCIGCIVSLLVARYFPIRQTRKIFQFVSVLFITLIVLLVRMLQPEKLFSIRDFTEIQTFIENLQVPFFQYIPSTWLSEIAISLLLRNPLEARIPASILFVTAIILVAISFLLGKFLFYQTWCRTREMSSAPVLDKPSASLKDYFKWLGPTVQSIYSKDAILFARNPELWSQIFLIFAMVGLYLYNIHLMRLDKVSLYSHSISRFIAYMNTAFVGFITTSVSMRFLFPALSLEGRAFWILKTAPFNISKLLSYKFWFYIPWILIIGNTMTILANYILDVPWYLYLINGVNITCICITNSMLAICFGAIYPNYKAENINKIFMSFGGTFYMVASLAFMFLFLMCQSYPGILIYRANVRNQDPVTWQIALAIGWVLVGFVIMAAFLHFPYKWAVRAVNNAEAEQ